MNLAVALLLLFLVIMFSGSMLPPISEAAAGVDMGTMANPFKLLVPMFIVIVLLFAVIRLAQER